MQGSLFISRPSSIPSSRFAHPPEPLCQLLAQGFAQQGRIPAAAFIGGGGRQWGTCTGLRASSTATMVKKQLLTCRTTCERISSATTLMPTSIDELPV